jgi:peptide/nickel transport system ATP-binding protein
LLACLPGHARVHRQAGGVRPRLAAIPGQVASPLAPPPGCAFAPRCPHVQRSCENAVPELVPLADGQSARCILRKAS